MFILCGLNRIQTADQSSNRRGSGCFGVYPMLAGGFQEWAIQATRKANNLTLLILILKTSRKWLGFGTFNTVGTREMPGASLRLENCNDRRKEPGIDLVRPRFKRPFDLTQFAHSSLTPVSNPLYLPRQTATIPFVIQTSYFRSRRLPGTRDLSDLW